MCDLRQSGLHRHGLQEFIELTEERWSLYGQFANLDNTVRENTYQTLRKLLLTEVHKINFEQSDQNFLPGRLESQILWLRHLARQSPFDDVRTYSNQLLIEIQESSLLRLPDVDMLGPSYFVPLAEVIPVDIETPETRMLFTETFIQTQRLDHLTQIMGFHPRYLTCFHRAQQFLLKDEGPLPFHYRHYLAIIAACRHQCSYLVHIHTKEYIQKGGDPLWLESLDKVPEKFRKLQVINKLMAHRPWLITCTHIESLCRNGRHSWSMSELMHAIVLLAHFHSLCSMVFGCGITYELDDYAGRFTHSDGDSTGESDNETCPQDESAQVESLLESLNKLKEECDDYTEEEMFERYKNVESQSAEFKAKARPLTTQLCTSPMIDDPSYCYEDFAKQQENHIEVVDCDTHIPTFRASDYSWEAHGFSIANRFYADVANYLDEKFSVAKELTYYTMGDKYKNVNTKAFRTGIWNYIHCVMGIKHDDYNYGNVNKLLERNLKSYIKTLTCYPERVTKRDFDSVMKGFKNSEKIHVNMILLEAKMQAELLYTLRAITQYMT